MSRQAGICSGVAGFDSGSLRFETIDDARNFADHIREIGRDFLTANNINCAKDYIEGKAEICVEWSAGRQSGELKFVAKIDSVMKEDLFKREIDHSGFVWLDAQPAKTRRYRDDSLVFFCGQSGQGPEKAVPSVVRVERREKRQKFAMDVAAFIGQLGGKLRLGSSKREIDPLRIRSPGHNSRVANGLIKRMSQVVYCVGNMLSCDWRQALHGAPAEDLLSRIRVCFFEDFVTASILEGGNRSLKIGGVYFRALDV